MAYHNKYVVVVALVCLVLLCCCCTSVSGFESGEPLSRRDWARRICVGGGGAIAGWYYQNQANAVEESAAAAGELPLSLRSFTKLAPLGKAQTTTKSYNLSMSELADRLTRDLTIGATGQGGYIVSGDLSTDIFRDDCVFLDPTNRVTSLSQYQKALEILFDPDRSVIQLLEPLQINQVDRTIRAKFRSRGFLKLPWNPYVSAYESDVLYRIDEETGLIAEQLQMWSKSSYVALRETFTPTIYTPPPASNVPPARDEPSDVTTLFQKVNGRRTEEYSTLECTELSQLMDRIVSRHYPFDPELFPGTWKLVYVEPGRDGKSGVDRRVPFFPELGFNDQYQVFGDTNDNRFVCNIGQLFGPNLFVRVLGTYSEVDYTSTTSPKRLQADITTGQLCWDGSGVGGTTFTTTSSQAPASCMDLPIQGIGIFDSLYLGKRVRILQNLNGTGARGVQILMG